MLILKNATISNLSFSVNYKKSRIDKEKTKALIAENIRSKTTSELTF